MADSLFQFMMFRNNLRYLIFMEPLSFSQALFRKIPPFALFTRLWFLVSCLIVGLVLDIYLKRLEDRDRALRISENRYRTLFDHSTDAVFFLDDKGVIQDFNKGAFSITSSIPEALLGSRLHDHLSPAGAEFLIAAMGSAALPSQIFEDEILLKGNKSIPVEVVVNPPDYDLNLTLVLLRDISRRRAADEERIKAAKLESLGLLAGGIAHDFNNQLTALTANISVALHSLSTVKKSSPDAALLDGLSPDIQLKDNTLLLREALSACKRASALTRQLLTFAKGGAPVLKKGCIGEMLRETMVFALRGTSIGYEIEIADGLWEVETDQSQISQVVNNLVINSVQAMNGIGRLKLLAKNVEINESFDCPFNACDRLVAGQYVSIVISDSGPGIPEDIIDRIFDPYFTTKQAGSGLGLASSYSIAKRHGGLLCAKSRLPLDKGGLEGAAFLLVLPRSICCASEQNGSENVSLREDGSDRGIRTAFQGGDLAASAVFDNENSKVCTVGSLDNIYFGTGRILVMDDEAPIRTVVAKILSRLGYEPIVSSNGEEAVEIFRREKELNRDIDVVIVDLTIPGGMGGLEAAREIWKMNPDARIVVSSGYSNDEVMSEHRQLGFAGVIAKPFDISTLSHQLKETLTAQK